MTNEVVPDKSGAKNTEPPSRLLTTLFLKEAEMGRSQLQRLDKEDLMYMGLEGWVEFWERTRRGWSAGDKY